MQLSVRDVDEKVFREFKTKVVNRKLKLGIALNLAMAHWLQEEKFKKSILDFKPMDWGPGTENISMEVDKILYGKED